MNELENYIQEIENKVRPYLDRTAIRQTSLSLEIQSIILGGLLGDGSLKLHKNYANPRYAFRHSEKQSEYFHFKAFMLFSISSPKSIQKQKPDGFSVDNKLRFCSRALPDLRTIWERIGENNLEIKRNWLNLCTELSLAIWWCDDGSLIKHGRYGSLATHGFSEKENQLLINWLDKAWGIKARLIRCYGKNKVRNSQYSLNLSNGMLKKFLSLILPHCPCESMLYKFAIRYNDTNYQERWISWMEKRLPAQLAPKVRKLSCYSKSK